jgi:hypothetical protein
VQTIGEGVVRRTVGVSWAPMEAMPVSFANAFAWTVIPNLDGRPGELVLSVGYLVPPILTGTAEDQVAQMAAVEKVEVRPVARLLMSQERAAELALGLSQVLAALKTVPPRAE